MSIQFKKVGSRLLFPCIGALKQFVFKLICDFLKTFQVAEIQEDVIEDVSILTENVDFLFDKQVIQDDRLLNLETETEGIQKEVKVDQYEIFHKNKF